MFVAGHAGWTAYNMFLIVSLSGRPVYDPNSLRFNLNPQKSMSCSCRIRELGQIFTSLFLGVGPIHSLFSLFFFFFFFSFFFFFPWRDWLVGCFFFFLFFFGLSRCEFYFFYFFWHEFYFLINLGRCLFFFWGQIGHHFQQEHMSKFIQTHFFFIPLFFHPQSNIN